VLAAVFGEWIAAQSGLGLYISRSDNAFRTDQVFVGVVIVALASIALFAVVNLLARVASPWMYVNDQQEGR
jgi:ABC-type nitrate/sulfonate/bicarbonate transport system permease component